MVDTNWTIYGRESAELQLLRRLPLPVQRIAYSRTLPSGDGDGD